MGMLLLRSLPTIDRDGSDLRRVTLLVFIGGLGRLYGLITVDFNFGAMIATLGELFAFPLLFKQFDNGNGRLSLAEIDRAIIHFYPQFGTNKKAIVRAYKAADTSGNGFVELREFEKIVQLLKQYDEISKIFEELDINDDHRIGFNEFKKGFQLLGEDDSDEDSLKQEFDAIDSNDGGYILFDEVRNLKKKQLNVN
ncbi:unnamed protein product [Rotaria sp. Silwood1]|nr:unnamed protein product [Rotaria sp. Silwood1]CAF4944941.1 unnamed protein product [Rotaria sp. Silwood1]